MQIPPNTTGTTQLLDVFYFRQWKGVVRRMYDYVQLNGMNVKLAERDNIITMQSLVHNQFSSDRFVPMGRFAWYAAGLRDDDPGPFETAAAILFPRDLGKCECGSCAEKAFIRCSHCRVDLCFSHFFVAYHTHLTDEADAVSSPGGREE